MKAKEHIGRYRQRIDDGMAEQNSMGALFKELIDDALTVAIQRSGRPRPHDRVLRVTLGEANAKWRKIAQEMDWNPDGFKVVLAEKGLHI